MRKSEDLTNEDLQVLYDGFNKQFFFGKLPYAVKVKFVSAKQMREAIRKKQDADAVWRPHLNEIWLDVVYARSESITCILLLHEMAHVALEATYFGHPNNNPGHGMIYQAELFRLIMAGAYDGLL